MNSTLVARSAKFMGCLTYHTVWIVYVWRAIAIRAGKAVYKKGCSKWMIFFSWLFYKPLIIHFCLTLCYTKSFWLPTNINRRLFSYYICLLSQNVHLSFPLSEFLMYIWKVTKTVTSHVQHTLTTGIIKTYLYKNTFDLFAQNIFFKQHYQQTIILNRRNQRFSANYEHIAMM